MPWIVNKCLALWLSVWLSLPFLASLILERRTTPKFHGVSWKPLPSAIDWSFKIVVSFQLRWPLFYEQIAAGIKPSRPQLPVLGPKPIGRWPTEQAVSWPIRVVLCGWVKYWFPHIYYVFRDPFCSIRLWHSEKGGGQTKQRGHLASCRLLAGRNWAACVPGSFMVSLVAIHFCTLINRWKTTYLKKKKEYIEVYMETQEGFSTGDYRSVLRVGSRQKLSPTEGKV